ncbi:MAG: hypothetical protein WC046_06635 [Candidatus Bathyarchaeia archaeon]
MQPLYTVSYKLSIEYNLFLWQNQLFFEKADVLEYQTYYRTSLTNISAYTVTNADIPVYSNICFMCA